MKPAIIAASLIILSLSIGWVINIITIVNHINDPVTGMQVLRAVGIFVAPLGGILGYI